MTVGEDGVFLVGVYELQVSGEGFGKTGVGCFLGGVQNR